MGYFIGQYTSCKLQFGIKLSFPASVSLSVLRCSWKAVFRIMFYACLVLNQVFYKVVIWVNCCVRRFSTYVTLLLGSECVRVYADDLTWRIYLTRQLLKDF